MKSFEIGSRAVGENAPCYVIAEISCNHEGDFDEARRIVEAAAAAGADAVKLQTYTADTLTRDFKTKPVGTMWEKVDLYKLYQKAHTPWSWYGELKKIANDCGVDIFSTPFDETAVDFLMDQDVPVMKVASFEVVDIKLLEKIASTGKPVVMSNGMTDFLEMDEAVRMLRAHGAKELAILHCNSGYPASFDEVNALTIPAISAMYGVTTGISDHTIFADDKDLKKPMAHITPLEAVKMGAKIVEVHLMLDREKGRSLHEKNEGGFDWAFSREPSELKKMISMIRAFERTGSVDYETEEEREAACRTHGKISFDPTPKEMSSRTLRPSLWVVENIAAGQPLKFAGGKQGNFDSIRPGGGLHIRFADFIENRVASRDITAGEPMTWDMIKL